MDKKLGLAMRANGQSTRLQHSYIVASDVRLLDVLPTIYIPPSNHVAILIRRGFQRDARDLGSFSGRYPYMHMSFLLLELSLMLRPGQWSELCM